MKNRKLGRRAPKHAPAIPLGEILTGVVPAHSAEANHLGLYGEWGMYGNDRYGVCGPTSVAHSRKLVTAYLTGSQEVPSQADVFDLYRRSGNPRFDPASGRDDNGVVMQTMLEACTKGGIGGVKALAFARVDTRNLDQMRAAIDIFGFVLQGVNLQQSQQHQTDAGLWDYSPSGIWGGHAILGGRYRETPGKDDTTGIVSWNQLVTETESFLENQLDEAWVLIWPEALGSRQFREGINMAKLKESYKDITGRDLPVGDDPPPDIDPPPPPPPDKPSWVQQQIDNVFEALEGRFARNPFILRVIKQIHAMVDAWLQKNPAFGQHHRRGSIIPTGELKQMIDYVLDQIAAQLTGPAKLFLGLLKSFIDAYLGGKALPDPDSVKLPEA